MLRLVPQTWLVAQSFTTQRLEACVNRTAGEACSWAGAFSSVHRGVCKQVGPTNSSVVACIVMPRTSKTSSTSVGNGGMASEERADPQCASGVLHRSGGVCCPVSCGISCRFAEDEGEEERTMVDAADSQSPSCTIEVILRTRPSCAVVGPPCVLEGTQGAPAMGFVEATSSGIQDGGGAAATGGNSYLGESVAEGSLGAGPSPAASPAPKAGAQVEKIALPVVFGAASGMVVLCLCCCFIRCVLMAKTSGADDVPVPPESPLNGASVVRPLSGSKPRRRKRKTSEPNTVHNVINDQPASSPEISERPSSFESDFGYVSYGDQETHTYDDFHLFKFPVAPTPIVDVWGVRGSDSEQTTPPEFVQSDDAPMDIIQIDVDGPPPTKDLQGRGSPAQLVSSSKSSRHETKHARGSLRDGAACPDAQISMLPPPTGPVDLHPNPNKVRKRKKPKDRQEPEAKPRSQGRRPIVTESVSEADGTASGRANYPDEKTQCDNGTAASVIGSTTQDAGQSDLKHDGMCGLHSAAQANCQATATERLQDDVPGQPTITVAARPLPPAPASVLDSQTSAASMVSRNDWDSMDNDLFSALEEDRASGLPVHLPALR